MPMMTKNNTLKFNSIISKCYEIHKQICQYFIEMKVAQMQQNKCNNSTLNYLNNLLQDASWEQVLNV